MADIEKLMEFDPHKVLATIEDERSERERIPVRCPECGRVSYCEHLQARVDRTALEADTGGRDDDS